MAGRRLPTGTSSSVTATDTVSVTVTGLQGACKGLVSPLQELHFLKQGALILVEFEN